jgi:polyribonucleotide 5'-hydroxyl-kinase
MVEINTSDLPAEVGERHVLQAQEELRFEIPFSTNSCSFILQKGSCELWGCELAMGKTYTISNGGLKVALFTWHGCVVDIDSQEIDSPQDTEKISYCSQETDANVSFVNTHAQLEALRDEAASSQDGQGPRVMIVGPPESGKSSLAKMLVAYATKVGRTPVWVDLDPLDNALSVPGTLAAAPMTAAAVTVDTYATCGIPPNTSTTPLVVWHGSSSQLHPDLFRAQVSSLARKIEKRLEGDDLARSSGLIINTNGWIQDEGYPLLLDAAETLKVNILLIMGHDRLYSMMTNHYKKNKSNAEMKILKLPRSGGVVSRSSTFMRSSRSRAVKRYFYGDMVDPPATSSTSNTTSGGKGGSSAAGTGASSSATSGEQKSKVPQLTPFLLQIPFSDVKIYKLSSISLSSSLLPVAATQSTDAIQLTQVELTESLQHSLLAVCHPTAVQAYTESGRARDLVTAGVAGFCAVERVIVDSDMLHLLSPCAGSLPSNTLLLGDITWIENV